MQVDVNKLVDRMSRRIAELEKTNIILQLQVEQYQEKEFNTKLDNIEQEAKSI